MKTALWIIAICTVIRIIQNTIQLSMLVHDQSKRDKAYDEYAESLQVVLNSPLGCDDWEGDEEG